MAVHVENALPVDVQSALFKDIQIAYAHDMRNELPKETLVEPKQPERLLKPLQMWMVLFDRCPFG